jgi:diphosphomevalonate decarboxylase
MTSTTNISATVEWSSPSNLAIVKYWGKKGVQEPLNPSISFTLNNSQTKTKITAEPSVNPGFTFTLKGEKQPLFNAKIESFLKKAQHHLPFIRHHHLSIESSNTFPHSSGIASSASSMSALALGLISLHNISLGNENAPLDMLMASGLARLGSGSACRSVFGGWALWGRYNPVKESSDMYAISVNEEIHQVFKTLNNTILIIDPAVKKVSSSDGHALMENHPYREARISQANDNTGLLLETLKSGDLATFFSIAENEALSLHGLMMSSNPSYTLLNPNSLNAISAIRDAREKDGLPVGFSMDAGPNIHILYPKTHERKVRLWIDETLKPLCHNGQLLQDETGEGPLELKNVAI